MNEKLRLIGKLLRSQSTLVLATVDDDAQPRSTPLFFLADDELRLYWFSARSSRHSRYVARHGEAGVAVFRNTRKWQQIRGVQMQGAVELVRGRNLRRELTAEYRERFGLEESFGGVLGRSALYCFTPSWARYMDNGRGFGYKFEVRLGGKPVLDRPPRAYEAGVQ